MTRLLLNRRSDLRMYVTRYIFKIWLRTFFYHDSNTSTRKCETTWAKSDCSLSQKGQLNPLWTIPLAIWEHNGKRYIGSVYGIVDWVRNLRAAGEVILTRGRRSKTVKPL